jgi:hypothetical protein
MREDGYRWANADPVTGQAAWYDLKVRLEKAKIPASARLYPTLPPPPGTAARPAILRYGARLTGWLKEPA